MHVGSFSPVPSILVPIGETASHPVRTASLRTVFATADRPHCPGHQSVPIRERGGDGAGYAPM